VVFSVREVFGHDRLAKGLDTVLDEIVQATTKGLIQVTLTAALKVALEANKDIPSPIHTTPLIVAVRAARAASQTAARRAIHSALLDLATSSQSAGNAATNAFLQRAGACCSLSDSQRELIQPDITKPATQVRINVTKAFLCHFEKVGMSRRNDISYAAKIVHRSTATAIYFAAKAKVKQAVEASMTIPDPEIRNECLIECGKALKLLSSPDNNTHALHQAHRYFRGFVDIISHQVVQVPGLFRPIPPNMLHRRESTNNFFSST
jgi:hypothetical protein